MNKLTEIQQIASMLSDPKHSEAASDFPQDLDRAGKPGLYSWWADREAQKLFLQATGFRVPRLFYVGQAGATRRRSGSTSSATLNSRIRNNHIRGNLGSSTFRHTISALLSTALNLRLKEPGKLSREDNLKVTEWIKRHLRVAIVPFEDRDSLKCVEQAVLNELDPPFNLEGCDSTNPIRQRLKELRRKIKQATPE